MRIDQPTLSLPGHMSESHAPLSRRTIRYSPTEMLELRTFSPDRLGYAPLRSKDRPLGHHCQSREHEADHHHVACFALSWKTMRSGNDKLYRQGEKRFGRSGSGHSIPLLGPCNSIFASSVLNPTLPAHACITIFSIQEIRKFLEVIIARPMAAHRGKTRELDIEDVFGADIMDDFVSQVLNFTYRCVRCRCESCTFRYCWKRQNRWIWYAARYAFRLCGGTSGVPHHWRQHHVLAQVH